MLITFSGLDGAGKSTLILGLKTAFEERNHKVTVLTMYDHLSFYALVRAGRDYINKLSGTKDEHEINSVESPHVLAESISACGDLKVNSHNPKTDVIDKKTSLTRIFYSVVRSTVVRQVALILDLLIILVSRIYFEKIKRDILITDRFLYDSLVDVADLQSRRWLFVKLYLLIAPTPDIPIFVDVSPEKAFARKGEYTIDYMRWRQVTYQQVFGWVHHPLIIVNNDLAAAQRALVEAVCKRVY